MNKRNKKAVYDAMLGKTDIIRVLNISKLWTSYEVEEMLDILLSKNTKSTKIMINSLFPNSYSELCSYSRFKFDMGIPLSNIVIWYSSVIKFFSKEIKHYQEIKDTYYNLLLLKKYGEARELLELLKKQGCSLWSLENEFILDEYEFGLERNKHRLSEYETLDCSIWISVFAEFFSFKAEKGISNRQYLYRIERMLENTPDEISAFIEEKMYPIESIKEDNIRSILILNSGGSVFDIYDTFIRIGTWVMSHDGSFSEERKVFYDAFSKIEMLENPIINKFLLDANKYSLTDIDKKMFEIGNLYTEGKYDQAINESRELIKDKVVNFELLEYYVKSHIMSNQELNNIEEQSIADDLISAMYNSYLHNKDVKNSLDVLFRVERITSNAPIGSALASFIIDKYTTELASIQNKIKEYQSPFLNIKFGIENCGGFDVEYLANIFEKGSSLELFLTDNKCSSKEIDFNRKRWYHIKSLSEIPEKIFELEEWYCEINGKEDAYSVYMTERITIELFYSYLSAGRVVNAEEIYVTCYLRNRYSVIRMDLDKITLYEKEDVKGSIYTPIIAYISSRDCSSIFSSLANYLDRSKFNKPSDMQYSAQEFDKDVLSFFLGKVCTCDVLDSFYYIYSSNEEVEDERLSICAFLQEFDSENCNSYVNEISEILKRRKILQGIKYIEKVKINLDYQKAISEKKSIFSDNLRRFIEIGNLGIEYKAIDLTNQLIYIKDTEKKEKYSFKLNLLNEIIKDFQHELAFGKYGLDQTLGTRIRHGILQNQIRSVFEKNEIVFVKENVGDAGYIIPQIFQTSDRNDVKAIGRILSSFSRKIDEYILELREKNIRVKINELNPDGLIDLSIGTDELVGMYEIAQKISNETMLLDAFEEFWMEKINISLEKARTFFSVFVKKMFIGMIDELEAEIEVIESDELKKYLHDRITKSRTEIQITIDNIANWFRLPIKKEYQPFDIQMLVETCETINQKVLAGYDEIKREINIDHDIVVKGEYFSYLVDIINIIFNNAYMHSGFVTNLSELTIELNVYQEKGRIIFEVYNNLSESIDKNALTERIVDIQNTIQEMIQRDQFMNFEGGSGFVKISKILQWDIEKVWNVAFGLDDSETHFFVKVAIESDGVVMSRRDSV